MYHRRGKRQTNNYNLDDFQDDKEKQDRLNKILNSPNYPEQSFTEMKLELRHYAQLYGGSVRQAYNSPYKFACKEFLKVVNGCGTWPFSIDK